MLEPIDAANVLSKIEYACRTCYQSYDKISEGSAERLIRSCIKRGHESVLEHSSLSFKIICDRSVLAQWTRHRLASYAVESQRYCNYELDKFGKEITCVTPVWAEQILSQSPPYNTEQCNALQRFGLIKECCLSAERNYFALIELGCKPEEARAILPNATKCTMIWTANMREIRHFIRLRASAAADPSIRKLAQQLLQLLKENGLNCLVEDLEEK